MVDYGTRYLLTEVNGILLLFSPSRKNAKLQDSFNRHEHVLCLRYRNAVPNGISIDVGWPLPTCGADIRFQAPGCPITRLPAWHRAPTPAGPTRGRPRRGRARTSRRSTDGSSPP